MASNWRPSGRRSSKRLRARRPRDSRPWHATPASSLTTSGRTMAEKILVIGAGAIGAFYGGVLAKAGCEVSAVARSNFDAVRDTGYRIDSHLGDLSWRPSQLVRSSAD